MPNFSTLTGRLLDQELHSDDSTVLFTTAKRNAAVNEGQREFARLTQCFVRRSTITVDGGTGEYDLLSTSVLPNGDFVQWMETGPTFRYVDASSNVTILAGKDFPQVTVDWLDRHEPGWQTSSVASSVAQLPVKWYERIDGAHRYVGFYPVPSTGSSASADFVITYRARPANMASTGDQPFTVNSSVRTDLIDYHQGLVHYAAHQLEKLRPDDQASASQLQKFLGYVTSYLQDHRIRRGTHAIPARSYFRASRHEVEDPRT